jgi:hypothetical protein
VSLRTTYAAALADLREARADNERAQAVRDAAARASSDTLVRLTAIQREVARMDSIFARLEAEHRAAGVAKATVIQNQAREFKRARSARRQERKAQRED